MRVTGMSDLIGVYHNVDTALDSGLRLAAFQGDDFSEVS